MLNIPTEQLPDEFRDESRLDSLFSPFRSRKINPRDWTSKVSSWRQLITLYCSANHVYSFSISSLKGTFIRNGRPPTCLEVVVDEMVKAHELQDLNIFLKSQQSWGGWAADILVKKPISWSFNTLKSSLFTTNINTETTYVYLAILQDDAEKLLAAYPQNYKNKVIDFETFLTCTPKNLNQVENARLLLHHLVQKGNADVAILNKSTNETTLVKVSNMEKVKISEVDIGVCVLERNEEVFSKHVAEIEDEIAECLRTIKGHLLKGHRQLAKTCLKKKHEMEKRLMRKVNALHNVQMLLEKLRDVHSDADVWQSYKQALKAFNTTFKETGLDEDDVEDTMLQIGEMLDIQEDVERAMSTPVVVTDDADLEEELAELLNTDKEESQDSKLEDDLADLILNDLPEVPKTDISTKISN